MWSENSLKGWYLDRGRVTSLRMHILRKGREGKEALQTFRELYLLLKEKVLGADEVLDDIIKSGEDIPF